MQLYHSPGRDKNVLRLEENVLVAQYEEGQSGDSELVLGVLKSQD